MLPLVVRPFELGRGLEGLAAAFERGSIRSGDELRLLRSAHRREAPCQRHVRAQLAEARHARHLCGDRLAQRIAVGGGRRNAALLHDRGAVAPQALHADDTRALRETDRDDVLLEAPVGGVHHVDGHLAGVPVEGLREHGEVVRGVLVAREADEAHLAGLTRLEGGPYPALVEDPVRVLGPVDLVELPEVDVIRAEAAQAVLELAARAVMVAVADLGHQEDALAPPVHGQRPSHQLLGAAVVVVPRVVEERDAFVEGRVHEADGLEVVRDRADVPAAQAEDRDALSRSSERPRGQAGRGGGGLAREHVLRREGIGHWMSLATSSLAILAATRAVVPSGSQVGLSSTTSAPTTWPRSLWTTPITSRVERPPGSGCETPGA